MSRTPVKQIAIAVQDESNQNVYVWQVGKDRDVTEGFPEASVTIGLRIEVMDGKTGSCMSQMPRESTPRYSLRSCYL